MKTLIVIAHPYAQSFNYAVLEQVVAALDHPHSVIDLYADRFEPTLRVEELKLYNQGVVIDQKILDYQALISSSTQLIFIFPIWWYGLPAMMKGFMDKVFTPGFAFDETRKGLVGKLNHIERVLALTTSEVTTDFLKTNAGNPIESAFLNTTLSVCGINQRKVWLNCERVGSGGHDHRRSFLNQVAQHIKTL